MSKRSVVVAVIVLAVATVTAGAVVLIQRAGPRSFEVEPPQASPRVYAYLKVEFGQSWLDTRSELIAMDGTRQVGRAPLGLLGTDPAFTTDGRYAFSLGTAGLIAIPVATGKGTTVPCDGCWDQSLECQCQTVVPVGASRIAWLDSENHLMVTDLAMEPPTPQRTATTVPTWSDDRDEKMKPHLLAGTDGAALAGFPTSLSGGTGPVYLVTPDGSPRLLAHGRKDSIKKAEFSPDGTRVALSGDYASDCVTVTVLDVASGKGTTSPVEAEPGARCASRDGYVGTLWWDPDGVLQVYFQPSGDDVMNGSQRRLDGDRWVAADAEPASQAHRLATDGTVILSRPGVRDQGLVHFEIGGKRKTIEGAVSRVVVAPGPAPTP